jgi:hypothetical protein
MDTIGVESTKILYHGFILTEQELRRLIALSEEQLQKSSPDEKPSTSYVIKYENGAIAETTSLDEVLQQENTGSSAVVKLRVKSEIGKGRRPTRINVEFIDKDTGDENDSASIKYHIYGKTRDWVFVTTSLIEERITKIKRFSFNQFLSKSSVRFFGSLIVPTVLMIALFIGLPSMAGRRQKAITEVESLWKQGQIKDPIDAMLRLQKTNPEYDVLSYFMPAIYILIFILILIGMYILCLRYYPTYNFCWGDYLHEFNRKESKRKFVLIGVVLTLIISFVGSLIANSFGVLHLF